MEVFSFDAVLSRQKLNYKNGGLKQKHSICLLISFSLDTKITYFNLKISFLMTVEDIGVQKFLKHNDKFIVSDVSDD